MKKFLLLLALLLAVMHASGSDVPAEAVPEEKVENDVEARKLKREKRKLDREEQAGWSLST